MDKVYNAIHLNKVSLPPKASSSEFSEMKNNATFKNTSSRLLLCRHSLKNHNMYEFNHQQTDYQELEATKSEKQIKNHF